MGIGMAPTEEVLVDERQGRIMNPSLDEHHVPVNFNVPHNEAIAAADESIDAASARTSIILSKRGGAILGLDEKFRKV